MCAQTIIDSLVQSIRSIPATSAYRRVAHRLHRQLGVICLLGLLAACDGGEQDRSTAAGVMAASGTYGQEQGDDGEARSAETVAQAARGQLRCPAPLITSARANGQPVDDVMGVRPGMGYDEAAHIILCTDELLIVDTEGVRGFHLNTFQTKLRQGYRIKPALAAKPLTQQEYLEQLRDDSRRRNNFVEVSDVPAGHSQWLVGTMGMKDQEKVINLTREQWFEKESPPSIAQVEQALLEKYGPPTKRDEYDGVSLLWAYDPLGRLVTETSRIFRTCKGDARIDGRVELQPDCGITIAAKVRPQSQNDLLAERLTVQIVDQARGNALIEETQSALLALEQTRKTEELNRAQGESAKVTL